jgi:hypothetical protein
LENAACGELRMSTWSHQLKADVALAHEVRGPEHPAET